MLPGCPRSRRPEVQSREQSIDRWPRPGVEPYMKRSDLPIASPCSKDWDTMTAAGRKRFCSDCKKHVHDMSCMSRSEAGAFLREHAGQHLCVRYAHDSAGNLLFAPAELIATSSLMSAVRGLAAAAVVSAGGYAYQQHQASQASNGSSHTLGAVTIAPSTNDPIYVPTEIKTIETLPPETRYRMGDVAIEPPIEQEKTMGEIAVPQLDGTAGVSNIEGK